MKHRKSQKWKGTFKNSVLKSPIPGKTHLFVHVCYHCEQVAACTIFWAHSILQDQAAGSLCSLLCRAALPLDSKAWWCDPPFLQLMLLSSKAELQTPALTFPSIFYLLCPICNMFAVEKRWRCDGKYPKGSFWALLSYRSLLMREKTQDEAVPSAVVFIEVLFLVQSLLVFCWA